MENQKENKNPKPDPIIETMTLRVDNLRIFGDSKIPDTQTESSAIEVALLAKSPSTIPANPLDGAEIPDHPKGDEIRRQVEYYFSDENLPTDMHLLEKCGGCENNPVPIKHICGFSKMRKYKPYLQVVEALRRSDFLEVTEDKKVKRRVPISRSCLDLDWKEKNDGIDKLNSNSKPTMPRPERLPDAPKVVDPRATKPGMTKGMLKPTGMEEYFADAPVTPAEFEEERAMYDLENDFHERIETAIQRYKARRKFHQGPKRVFDALMHYSGIYSGPKQFTGNLTPEEMERYDAGDIARLNATHFVGEDKYDDTKWSVDFVGVAQGFLSSNLMTFIHSLPSPDPRIATHVLQNFYNYLLHHNVCVEHTDAIYKARAVCKQHDAEWPLVEGAGHAMPGAFSVACSTLFGGYFENVYIGGEDHWSVGYNFKHGNVGMSTEEARIVFTTGIAAYGTDTMFALLFPSANISNSDPNSAFKLIDPLTRIRVGCTLDLGLEVIGKSPASPEIRAVYDGQTHLLHGRDTKLKPLGILQVRYWNPPGFEEWDLPDSVLAELASLEGRTFDLWLEDEVLEMCFVGMKMEGKLRSLVFEPDDDNGNGNGKGVNEHRSEEVDGFEVLGLAEKKENEILYFEGPWQTHVSFYRYLPNELVLKPVKEIRWFFKDGEKVVEGGDKGVSLPPSSASGTGDGGSVKGVDGRGVQAEEVEEYILGSKGRKLRG
ncbi:hypothetical protein M501DRAFT_1031764 [Patellaria atrata CBS 101060]|uniref:HTH La-type RNA-binding domain-containing protein n=1 Tax=Patellaria atrata CBS 101060 TaxID=1346257 RepID=A0A9P4SBQ1_9PEZI|nr:hypothetical protein M501DRAFT_1031764 [Patellaria atrata CBS 101060]